MAFGGFLDDDFLESLPDEGETIMRAEVVGPQAGRTPRRPRDGTYAVPTVAPSGGFESTGPFVREGGGVASRVRMNPALAGGFPSLGQDDPDGMKAGRAHLRNLMKAQKIYAMNLAAKDPQAAGMAFADLDGMRDGFGALVGDDSALIDNYDPLANRLHLCENMGGEDNGMALAEGSDKISDLENLLRVKAYRRLVEDDNLRISNESLGDADSLLITL